MPKSKHTLRQRAEELLRGKPADVAAMLPTDVRTLIQELSVYQMELELQNEELREAQLEIARTRDRFADLYDFAPVGYVSMDAGGRILDANLTAATLLGVERTHLVGTNISKWLDRESQDACYLHRQAVFSRHDKQICEVRVHAAKGTRLTLRLESIAFADSDLRHCRTAMLDVTDQKCAETDLSELNDTLEQRVTEQTHEVRLLAEAISHLGEGVMITTDGLEWPGPTIVFVNEAMCRISGYDAAELIGQSPRILQGDGTDRKTLALIREQLLAGQACSAEVVNYRKDGTPYSAEFFVTPLYDSAGHRTNFVSIHRDVTFRRHADRELREREAEKNAILASLSAHIAVIDTRGTIVAVNPAWEDFARANGGTPRGCCVGANYLAACESATGVDAEEGPKVAAGLRAVLDGRSPSFQITYPCHSATRQRWFLLQATPLNDPRGGAVVSHTNITSRIEAEEALRREHELSEHIIAVAQSIVLLLDREGRIVRFNPFLERLCGWSPEEVQGRDWFETFLPPHEQSSIRRMFETALNGERIRGHVSAIVTRNGQEREIEWYDAALTDARGTLVGLLWIGQDVTDARNLARHVLHATVEEQRRIGQDLHDSLGQELAGLNMTADALASLLRRSATVADGPLVEMASQLASGMQEALRQLKAVARGLHPVEVDPPGLDSALHELARHISELYGMQCRYHGNGTAVVADKDVATHLYRIAQEAATNAVTHGHAGQVIVSLEKHADTCRLQIRDNGSGMPPNALTRGGLGVRSMNYRAGLIGGRLSIEPAKDGGTLVSCVFRTDEIRVE